MIRISDLLKFQGLNFAAGASATPGGAPAAPGGAAPPAAPTPPEGEAGKPGAGAPPSDNIRQLREAYEGIKAKYEPWDKLGLQPDQVGAFSGVYQRVFEEVAGLGRELGFPDDEIAEALHEDPIATLDYLRNQAYLAEQQQHEQAPPDAGRLAEMIEQQVADRLGPVEQRENLRMTNEANSLFERTTYQLALDSFKAEGIEASQIPQGEMQMLMATASEILKYDEDAVKALKYEGKTAPIQQAFQEARTMLDKYYLARSQRERGRTGGVPPKPGMPPGPPGARGPTLDELAERPELINPKYAER